MTKKHITKVLIILGASYLSLAMLAIALNGFSLANPVSRYELGQCPDTMISGTEEYCAETQEIRTAGYFDWINWTYFSDNRGIDNARYIPIDIAVAVVIIGSSYAASKINSSKSKSIKKSK